MSSCLVIIDLENGFINANEQTKKLPERIVDYVQNGKNYYDHVVSIRFINSPYSPLATVVGYTQCISTDEQKLYPETKHMSEQVFNKYGYSCWTDEFDDFVKAKDIDTIYFCGCDTDACVLFSAVGAFERNIKTYVYENLCASSLGPVAHSAGLLEIENLCGKQTLIHADFEPSVDDIYDDIADSGKAAMESVKSFIRNQSAEDKKEPDTDDSSDNTFKPIQQIHISNEQHESDANGSDYEDYLASRSHPMNTNIFDDVKEDKKPAFKPEQTAEHADTAEDSHSDNKEYDFSNSRPNPYRQAYEDVVNKHRNMHSENAENDSDELDDEDIFERMPWLKSLKDEEGRRAVLDDLKLSDEDKQKIDELKQQLGSGVIGSILEDFSNAAEQAVKQVQQQAEQQQAQQNAEQHTEQHAKQHAEQPVQHAEEEHDEVPYDIRYAHKQQDTHSDAYGRTYSNRAYGHAYGTAYGNGDARSTHSGAYSSSYRNSYRTDSSSTAQAHGSTAGKNYKKNDRQNNKRDDENGGYHGGSYKIIIH